MNILDSKTGEILKSVLEQNSIDTKYKTSKSLHFFLQKIVDHELTKADWDTVQKMIQTNEIDEKTVIREVFNGSRGEYLEFKKQIENPTTDNQTTIFADKQEAILFQQNDHNVVLNNNKNRLGTSQFSIETEMIKSGFFKSFSAKGLMAFAWDNYKIYLSYTNAVKLTPEINKRLRESSYNYFEGEDLITKTAIKIIQQYCLDKRLDPQTSDMLGIEVRRLAVNAQRNLGRTIAISVIKRTNVGALTKLIRKASELLEQGVIEPVEEVTAYLSSGKKSN